MRYPGALCLTIIIVLFSAFCQAEEFPYRKDYPHVPVIELADMKFGLESGTFLMVDVRSKLEFDTIHAKSAVHIPMSDIFFEENIIKLAASNPGRKIAAYCNGVTCLKSYKAVERAKEAGMSDVYAFDAGIPAWANSYPSETLLLGREISDPAKQLISKSEFKKVCLDYEQFKLRASNGNSVVIDARDAIQKTSDLPGLEGAKHIPLDKFIKNVVNRGVMKDKQMLIFDQVGKQVRWLMYHLVNQGYADFYFLQDGATSVLKEQDYR